jgi:hypothetical protein
MVEFSVRIDFYRDPKGPTDYVGSASAMASPRWCCPGSAST